MTKYDNFNLNEKELNKLNSTEDNESKAEEELKKQQQQKLHLDIIEEFQSSL